MEFAFVDLLNSDWHDYRGSGRTEDRLDKPDWLRHYLTTWGLVAADRAGSTQMAGLKKLRSLLRRMVDDLTAGRDLSAADLARLNAVMAAAPTALRLVPDGGGYRLESAPIRQDWGWALATIAASFADMLVNHDPRRLKVCENPDCGWVFYDESRNRTRRWCEGGICGNLVKVRRFRARARQAPDQNAMNSKPKE